jgi:heparan-alpha-glucosaminide N-acetyltransferase
MTTTISTQNPSEELTQRSATGRLASIDVFRGLTMVAMIFVNDLASVHGLPWWNYHMKAEINAMTYVDMVFPFFLFIVGLSIPLAVRQRLKKNPSMPALWLHVFIRAASLIVLGLILANAEAGDRRLMGIDPNAWALLALTGAAMFLSVYSGPRVKVHRVVRAVGLLLTIAMYAIFRRISADGEISWIDGSYPEILGLIGYTYLVVASLYIVTRRLLWAPVAWFVALLIFNVLTAAGWVAFQRHVPLYFWPIGNGAMGCITTAGVVVSVIFLGDHRWEVLRQRIFVALGFASATLVAGWLLVPLGISKIRATPTWSLYCVGAAVLAFTALYWICDVKKKTSWAFFARPAGANTLLTYLLPDFYYFFIALIGFSYFARHFNFGWPGAVRSAVFTALILAVAGVFTRLRIRLQL